MIALLLALGLARADAPTPVIYDKGTPQAARERVADALGEDVDTLALAPQLPRDLLSGHPQLIGGGSAERCRPAEAGLAEAQGVPLSRVADRITEIQRLIKEEEWERALQGARSAELLLPCLSEVLPRELGRDFYALMGAAASRLALEYEATNRARAGSYAGDAQRAFEAWRRFIPDDRELERAVRQIGSPDGYDLALKVSAQRVPSTSLRVLPDVAALWIDGRPLSPEDVHRLLLGRHLVQLRSTPDAPVQSLWVTLDARSAPTLAVPELIPADLSAWVEDRERQDELAALLGVLGEEQSLYLVTPQGEVWRGVAGRADAWTSLSGDRGGLSLHRAGRLTLLSGGALAGAGVTTMVASCVASRVGADDTVPLSCGLSTGPAFQTFRVGQTAMLSGLGLMGLGLGMQLADGRSLVGQVSPQPGGLTLSVSVGAPPRLARPEAATRRGD